LINTEIDIYRSITKRLELLQKNTNPNQRLVLIICQKQKSNKIKSKIMKKQYILSSLFLTIVMQGQVIPQPQSTSVPSIKIGKSTNFELKNGLKVMVVENHKLPRVSYSLSLDNMPY
jgi:hypothetical protein